MNDIREMVDLYVSGEISSQDFYNNLPTPLQKSFAEFLKSYPGAVDKRALFESFKMSISKSAKSLNVDKEEFEEGSGKKEGETMVKTAIEPNPSPGTTPAPPSKSFSLPSTNIARPGGSNMAMTQLAKSRRNYIESQYGVQPLVKGQSACGCAHCGVEVTGTKICKSCSSAIENTSWFSGHLE